MPPAKGQRPPGYAVERAKFWGVSLRVMTRLLSQGVPVDSMEAMRSWYASLPPDTQGKITAALREKIVGATGKRGKSDADYEAFIAGYSEEQGDKTVLADLKKQLAFYMFKHRGASERNNGVGASEAMRQIKELASVVHDTELRAQKLGRDMGDLVPRADLERPARFLAYHLLRCADAALHKIAKDIAERDPKLPMITAPEIRLLGEPLLLTALVFDPMTRAMEGDNGAAPPEWLVKAMKDGLTEVVE